MGAAPPSLPPPSGALQKVGVSFQLGDGSTFFTNCQGVCRPQLPTPSFSGAERAGQREAENSAPEDSLPTASPAFLTWLRGMSCPTMQRKQ